MLSTDEVLFTCNITRFKIRRIWKVNTKTRLMLSIKLTILRCIVLFIFRYENENTN